jgi:hypothetical protein
MWNIYSQIYSKYSKWPSSQSKHILAHLSLETVISHHLNFIYLFYFFTSYKMRPRFVSRVSAPYLCTTLLYVLRIKEFRFWSPEIGVVLFFCCEPPLLIHPSRKRWSDYVLRFVLRHTLFYFSNYRLLSSLHLSCRRLYVSSSTRVVT